ncbi:MAG: hypothetical protein HeimC3_36060 [Candidatus Heimdallarchaeota archaeon LC_3]|nr:MAG: hypothetical protein HeimC3_36060 [Candidatus Heimdallarchaeota archaeon LC_3]
MAIGKISSKGTIVIPSKLRKKYNLIPGNEVEFIDTEEGIVIVPIVPIEHLIDQKNMKKTVKLINELEEERRFSAVNE